MEISLREKAEGYLGAAQGGLGKPGKFTVETLFQLSAMAIEGFLIGWLDDRGAVPSAHGFRTLVRAVETSRVLDPGFKAELLALDQFDKLCEWIPIEPRKPELGEIPGLLDLADRVRVFTAPEGSPAG